MGFTLLKLFSSLNAKASHCFVQKDSGRLYIYIYISERDTIRMCAGGYPGGMAFPPHQMAGFGQLPGGFQQGSGNPGGAPRYGWVWGLGPPGDHMQHGPPHHLGPPTAAPSGAVVCLCGYHGHK